MAVSAALIGTACTAPADSSAPLVEATTAAPECTPEQAELVLDPLTREKVLTRIEVFDIEAGGTSGSIVMVDDEERWLAADGLPDDPDWMPWLLAQAGDRYPDVPLGQGYHLSSRMSSEFPSGSERAGRYVAFRGLREVRVPFGITCATDRHVGTIRTWDLAFSGILQCGIPQDKSEVVTQAGAYCDRS